VLRVIKNACLLVRYLAIDILLLLRANFGKVFTEPLPSNGHTRHNIVTCRGVRVTIITVPGWMSGFIDPSSYNLCTNPYSTNPVFYSASLLRCPFRLAYIDAARTGITGNTLRDRYPLLLCGVIGHAQAARALHGNGPGTHLRETRHVTATHCCVALYTNGPGTDTEKTLPPYVAWRVCWNAPPEPPPSNVFSKSVTICFARTPCLRLLHFLLPCLLVQFTL
jgi:hypothetical protein